MNIWRHHGAWPGRRPVLVDGFRSLEPDVVALQEALVTDGYDQIEDVLGDGFHVAHQQHRGPDGGGISIASRWPIGAVHEVDLHVTARTTGFASAALIAEIEAPEPIGALLFVNHPPQYQLDQEVERELQTAATARFVEDLMARQPRHVVVAGDLNATPDAASIRFWTGRQSLQGLSVAYRDAWASTHPDEAGHTFSPENPGVTTGEKGYWALELGRRIDYLFVRCSDHGPTLDIRTCERLFDAPVDGVFGSDHFGVTADLSPFTPDGRPVP